MAKEPLRLSSERGAVLIQVAVCLLVLLAFSAFVVDYGVMWASRGQAQTAADAGALAGAVSLAYEIEGGDVAAQRANARLKAQAAAKENLVWGQQPDVDLTDITFPTCPPGAPGSPDTCVRVDTFRNQARDNALSMFFGNLVGIDDQGVRATATAQVIGADTTECLRPWAVIDRWNEFGDAASEVDEPDDDFTGGSTYDRYSTGKGGMAPQENDLYVAPSAAGPGTGFRLPDDLGKQFAVKTDTNQSASVSPGWFRAIRIPRIDCSDTGGGGSCYEDNIARCGGLPTTYWSPGNEPCPNDVGTDAEYWAMQGCYGVETGNMTGPTRSGVEELIATDPAAAWVGNGPTGYVENSIEGENWMRSPRIVPIGVVDIDWFLSQNPSGSNGVLRLSNIFGFFIEGLGEVDEATGAISCCNATGKAVVGRILTIPGMGASQLHSSATFLRTIILVR